MCVFGQATVAVGDLVRVMHGAMRDTQATVRALSLSLFMFLLSVLPVLAVVLTVRFSNSFSFFLFFFLTRSMIHSFTSPSPFLIYSLCDLI